MKIDKIHYYNFRNFDKEEKLLLTRMEKLPSFMELMGMGKLHCINCFNGFSMER